VAFLDGLDSIGAAQFEAAFGKLQAGKAAVPVPAAAPLAPDAASVPAAQPMLPAAAPEGLLLKDATLEDIVRLLHARNIEPTFRHLLPK